MDLPFVWGRHRSTEMSRETAQERLAAHMESAAHMITWSESRQAVEDGESASAALLGSETPAANQPAPPEQPAARPRSGEMPIARLPFELLPPGSWSAAQVIDHYGRLSRSRPNDSERQFDASRIERVCSLGAIKCWIGKEAWRGYHVFEFANSSRVVLECPYEGNATYVLWGNWKEMVSLAKAEIRAEYRNRHLKIVHKGRWLGRVRLALKSGQAQAGRAPQEAPGSAASSAQSSACLRRFP